MLGILDPTIATTREPIDYAPRPSKLAGLRVGFIDNTRKNSDAVLRELAARLRDEHGITLETLVRKHQRAPLGAAQLAEFRDRVDFAIAGVGD